MIVGVLVMCWLACVVVICAAMKRVTRPPWWETLLVELDHLELVGDADRHPTPREHAL